MHLIVAIAAAAFWNFAPVAAQTTTHPPYYPNGTYCTLARDLIYSGYSTDRSLQCYCVTQLRDWLAQPSPPTRTVVRTIGEGATTETLTSHGSKVTTTLANVVKATYLVSENGAYVENFNWYGSATSPCCSSCTVAAQTVDLFYFPTPAVKSQATSFVSNGYTFISPSVYIGFTSLYAYDFCGSVGQAYSSTTLEFNPSEISTLGTPVASTTTFTQAFEDYSNGNLIGTTTQTETWTEHDKLATRIDFRDLGPGCSSGVSGYTYLASEPYSQLMDYDPCHPVIALPPRLKTMVDPAWASCANNGLGGFYDPPSALTHVAALITSTSSTPIPTPQPVSSADPPISTTPLPVTIPPAPASTPDSPIVTPTPTTPVVFVTPTPSSDPPVVVQSPIPNPPVVNQSLTSDPPVAPVSSSKPAASNPAPADPVASNQAPASNPVAATPTPPSPIQASSAAAIQPVSSAPTIPPPDPDPAAQTLPGVAPPASQSTSQTPPLPTVSVAVPLITATILPPASQTLRPGAPAISSDGIVFTIPLSSSSAVAVIGSQTLVPGGPAITASDIVYSLPSTGGEVLANPDPTAATDPAMGSIILSMIGGSPPASTVTGGLSGSGSSTSAAGNATQSPVIIFVSQASRNMFWLTLPDIGTFKVVGLACLAVGFAGGM